MGEFNSQCQTGFGNYILYIPLKSLRNYICFLSEVVEMLRKTTLELNPSDLMILRALLPYKAHLYITMRPSGSQ